MVGYKELTLKKDILPVIDAIYAAGLDPVEWERSAYLIKDYIGGHTVNMLVHDIDNFNVNFSFTTALGNKDAAYYFENILPYDDINAIYDHITPSSFLTSDFFSDDEISRKFSHENFYKEFGMDRFDAVLIDQTEAYRAFLAVARSRHDMPFTPQDKSCLQQLLPHLQRALEINRRLSEGQMLASFSSETLKHLTTAVLLLDAKGHVVLRNTAAEKTEAEGYYEIRDKKLHLADSKANRELLQLLGSRFAAGSNNSIQFCHHSKAGVMLCCPLDADRFTFNDPKWAVFILREAGNFELPSEWMQAIYDLSKSELRVLELLLRGLNAPAIAEQLGISRDGVKFHLKNISTKTGSKSQVELVLKLAKSFSQVLS